MSQVIHNLSVREVYDKIAPDFDRTRVRVWGSVKTFMNIIPQNAAVLDLGCGNGKNMLYRNDLRIVGIDISDEQVRICKSKNLTVFQA
jgi:ubiquinone/menaquinone biosynthesis C-methylase UbiE